MSPEDGAWVRQISAHLKERAKLLDDMTALFAQSPYVSHVFARADEADSDFSPDLVVAFESGALDAAATAFETLVAQSFNLVFPGLFGKSEDGSEGVRFVFLISADERLFQLEVLLVSSEGVSRLPQPQNWKPLFTKAPAEPGVSPIEAAVPAEIAAPIGENSGMEQALIAVFHAGITVRSAIKRRDRFLNYSTTHQLNIAVRDLMRTTLDSRQVSCGWSGFLNALSSTELGLKYAPAFEVLISGSGIHTETTLLSAITLAIDFMKDADGATLKRLDEPIAYYLSCMGSNAVVM